MNFKMAIRSVLSGIFVVLALTCLSVTARSQFVVNTTSDAVVAGACAANAAGCSLRGAILAANANPDASTISFSIPAGDSGCVAGVCTINMGSVFASINTNVSINGPGPTSGNLVIRSNAVNVHHFSVFSPGILNLSYVTLTNGQNAGSGGAIYNPNGIVNIVGCTISGNQAIHGGTASGVYNGDLGTMTVVSSTLIGNSNTTGNGGAIVNHGTASVVNTTISGNTGNTNGGGIGNSGTLNLTNSTIIGNGAQLSGTGRGGGIFNSGTLNVKSTIIAGNSAALGGPDVQGVFASAGFNLVGKTDGSTGFTAATDQTGTTASPLGAVLGPVQNNGGPTHTAAVLAGSPALDKGTSNGLTGALPTDQRGAGFPRAHDFPAVPNAPGGDGTDIGAYERQPNEIVGVGGFDFDADGKTDPSVFRAMSWGGAEWWASRSSNDSWFGVPFGMSTDVVAPADFTGDRRTDVAFFRPATGQWFVLRSEDFSFFSFPFGVNGDIPVPGDFDADGKADAAVFRPSTATWFINRSTGGNETVVFGASGDRPVVADYDGDSRADIAIFRPAASGGEWWLRRSSTGVVFATVFGVSSDRTVQGDYTGDGKADIAFWRPSDGHWYILRSEDLSYFAFALGVSTDIPVPGDYDGDGKNDGAVFRPSTATWYANRGAGGTLIRQFGAAGDVPLPSAYVR
jgi:CSLREA domain-containing protein